MIRAANKKVTIRTLDGRMDGFDNRMDSLDTRMAGLDSRMDSLDTRMAGLDSRMDSLDTRMAGLDSRMDSLEESQHKMGVVIERLEAKFDLMLEGFASLVKRMDGLEARMEEGFQAMEYKFGVVFEKFDEIDLALARKANIAN